ncbi:9275_t:CDS:2, partial [Funneliformis caledonium]
MKSDLSSNDVISRINAIIERNQIFSVHGDLIHEKALNLFKYIDNNWDELTNNNDRGFLNVVLRKEWIPTFDIFGKKVLSKPQNCYCQKDKDLVCLVFPTLEYNVKNKKLLQHLKWDGYPEVQKVLKQLKICYDGVTTNMPLHENLEKICSAIYVYMNEVFQANDSTVEQDFEIIKKILENKPWILCGDTFRPANEVVFRLLFEFQSDIVELPVEYKAKFTPLFKAMGVRNEIGNMDLILIIKNMVKDNRDRVFSEDEIERIIQILKEILKEVPNPENLKEILVPNTENRLVKLDQIRFNDLKDRIDENEKCKHIIAHDHLTEEIAIGLEIETLIGEIFGNNSGDIIQDELSATRIISNIKDYSLDKLFKIFLQNADETKATRFSIIVDEREHNSYKKSLLSKEIKDWQGPAIWIYNDKNTDILSLSELGCFNCAFNFTDLPSIVSGKYIAFFDPNAKFLPSPKRSRVIIFDFIETGFKKKLADQCYPYEAIEGCDFANEFKGTLLRLPLRTLRLAGQSEISDESFKIGDILRQFINVQGNKEMLFLRYIESCNLYNIKEQQEAPQMLWQAQINHMLDNVNTNHNRNIRKNVTDNAQIYQFGIEINKIHNERVSEIWLLCTGGHRNINSEELRTFSRDKRLKPIGGVASLLARSSEHSLDELKDESFPNPPKIQGEMFSCYSLSISTKLGVHLNGNFSLFSERSNILNSESIFPRVDAKWNRYILYDVLPDLHVKLLDNIVKLEEIRHNRDSINFIPHTLNNLWPIINNSTMEMYKDYGLKVIIKLGINGHKIFWTKANDGRFVSLQTARLIEGNGIIIADILAQLGIQAVICDIVKLKQLENARFQNTNLMYTSLSGNLVCEELKEFVIYDDIIDYNSSLKLLNYILQDKSSFGNLTGLPLVPLNNGSVGNFGEIFYIGSQKHLDLFPNFGPSRIISVNLPRNLFDIFIDDEFSEKTGIKKFGAAAIFDLLIDELPELAFSEEYEWDPNGKLIPNNRWLEQIWSILIDDAEMSDFTKLSDFPLLPMTAPSIMLVRPDIKNPLLYDNEHNLFSTLVKLKIRFTNMRFSESANENLKQCVVQCTPINIINSLEQTRSSTMKELFESSDLSPEDYEMLRTFIKAKLEVLTGNQEDFMDILRSLPIWPIHSNEGVFIDVNSGTLYPSKLSYFKFHENTDFYKCDHESDFNALTRLGASSVNVLEYVKDPLLIIYTRSSSPFHDYIPFLQSVLRLEIPEIEQYLKDKQVVPKNSLSGFVSANELYDMNVRLFRIIFAESDKILPLELQNDPVCLRALVRIGLKSRVDCYTYIECAQYINLQIEDNGDSVRNQARYLVQYLYENVDTLNFNDEQWKRIKFVPSEKDLGQFYKESKETSGFETFESICIKKHKDVCWTQCPLYAEDIELPLSIGIPSTDDIIEHWFTVVEKIGLWGASDGTRLKEVINAIYNIMNERSQDASNREIISKIKGQKLFLNGTDPFNMNNWKAGCELIFGSQDDTQRGLFKVKGVLKSYKDLLKLADVIDPEDPTINDYLDMSDEQNDQKDKLLRGLLVKLISDEDHDVTFIVGGERIGANRHVLSAASAHFRNIPSEHNVPINDIQPDTFKVFLRWLYGQSFEDAKTSVLRTREDFTMDLEYETYYLYFFVHLLEITYIYDDVRILKGIVEDTIN